MRADDVAPAHPEAVRLLDRRAPLRREPLEVFVAAAEAFRELREHPALDGDYKRPCLAGEAGVVALERQEPVDVAGRLAAKLLRLLGWVLAQPHLRDPEEVLVRAPPQRPLLLLELRRALLDQAVDK